MRLKLYDDTIPFDKDNDKFISCIKLSLVLLSISIDSITSLAWLMTDVILCTLKNRCNMLLKNCDLLFTDLIHSITSMVDTNVVISIMNVTYNNR